MKFVFIDKNDKECDIITEILSSYNVLYKVHTRRQREGFCMYIMYDIEINVEPEFYEYLCKEIQPKLDEIELLETCYDLPDAIKEEKPKRKRRTRKKETSIENMFSDVFQAIGMLGGDSNAGTLIKFDDLPKDIQEQLLKRMPLDVLRSDKVRIRQTPMGISVEYHGEL